MYKGYYSGNNRKSKNDPMLLFGLFCIFKCLGIILCILFNIVLRATGLIRVSIGFASEGAYILVGC